MTTTTVPWSALLAWRPRGADGSDAGDGGGSDAATDQSGTDEGDAADDQGSEGADDTAKTTVSKADFDALQAKFDQMKTHLSANDKSKAALQAKLDEHERKGKTELENAQADATRLAEEAKGWQGKYEGLARTNSFLIESAKAKIAWHDPEVALAAATGVRELEIGDDGSIEGMAALVKSLAKSRPFLVNSTTSTGDGDDTNGKGASNGTVTGSKVGKGAGTKGKPGELSREELIKRFPSLRD